ncbi:MAG: SCO family protein [Vicinamibacterales bacterium]
MTSHLGTAAVALTAVLLVGTAAVSYPFADRSAAPAANGVRNGHVVMYWPGGVLKSDITYRDDAYEGDYRTFYPSGAPYEWRHYVNGHEEGLQQSWAEDGTLYLNYEVHDGRRYGLVNASPCSIVSDESAGTPRAVRPTTAPSAPEPTSAPNRRVASSFVASSLPFYDEATFTPHWTPVDHRVAAFTLMTESRTAISNRTLAGRPYVASFVYTNCAAVCPILVRQLSRVQEDLGDRARIVSFTVTPDADTPEVLAAFGHERGIDPSRWSLVTGSKRTIYTLARTSYFADDSRAGLTPDDERAFLHSEKLLLVDGNGQLRGIYNGTQPHAVDQLIDDFRTLSTEPASRR